jgi:hypothetical protein
MIFRLLLDGSMLFGYIFAPVRICLTSAEVYDVEVRLNMLLRRGAGPIKGAAAQPRDRNMHVREEVTVDTKPKRIDCNLYETGGRHATLSISACDRLCLTTQRINYETFQHGRKSNATNGKVRRPAPGPPFEKPQFTLVSTLSRKLVPTAQQCVQRATS